MLNYIEMIPCANLVGFWGHELARKLPRVLGILLETTLGSVVEIVLFMILLKNELYPVIEMLSRLDSCYTTSLSRFLLHSRWYKAG